MSKRKIGTHDGTFHCDEALACFMLKQLPEWKDAEITRTRDQSLLDQQDIVVDVGGVYDSEKLRFDHHQRGFTEVLPGKRTKLSSAGLIYKHYGRDLLKNMAQGSDEKTIDILYEKMYKYFLEEVDAVDNGINQYDIETPANYRVTTTLAARVSNLNPTWNDTDPQPNERFKDAMALTGKEFSERVHSYVNVWLPARKIVEEAINKRKEVDASGEIVLLEQYCPWKQHLYDVEEEQKLQPDIKFAIYQDQGGSWRVQAISKTETSFTNRVDLQWKGLRDETLSKASGIDGCVFVHASGFIGGNKTKEGALKMAKKSLAASFV